MFTVHDTFALAALSVLPLPLPLPYLFYCILFLFRCIVVFVSRTDSLFSSQFSQSDITSHSLSPTTYLYGSVQLNYHYHYHHHCHAAAVRVLPNLTYKYLVLMANILVFATLYPYVLVFTYLRLLLTRLSASATYTANNYSYRTIRMYSYVSYRERNTAVYELRLEENWFFCSLLAIVEGDCLDCQKCRRV